MGAVFVACLRAIQIAEWLHLLHPLSGPKPLQIHLWGYLIWALLQQFVLQDYFLLRLLRITHSASASVLIAAFLFAAAHIPNPALTVTTLFWGIAITVSNDITRHMRVGLGYIRYDGERGAATAIIPVLGSPTTTVQADGQR